MKNLKLLGYRYELFCLVRSCKTTHCIVIIFLLLDILIKKSCFATQNTSSAKEI